MDDLKKYCRQQYNWLLGSRKKMFHYCDLIPSADLSKTIPFFGNGGSIQLMLNHIIESYDFWIARHLVRMPMNRDALAITSYENIKDLFGQVDQAMAFLWENSDLSLNSSIVYDLNGVQSTATVFEVFTHVITHEFHHKGQILSMGRYLGYIPWDTDIL